MLVIIQLCSETMLAQDPTFWRAFMSAQVQREETKTYTSWWRHVNTTKKSILGEMGYVCVSVCTYIPHSRFGKDYLPHEQKERKRKRCFKEHHEMSGTPWNVWKTKDKQKILKSSRVGEKRKWGLEWHWTSQEQYWKLMEQCLQKRDAVF